MGMFATHARTEILDLRQVNGTLPSMVREAEWCILNHTCSRFVIKGFGPREESAGALRQGEPACRRGEGIHRSNGKLRHSDYEL